MNDVPAHQHTRDILAELEAEVAHEMDEDRPPAGGPAYQTVGALVGVAIGAGGAVLAYGYGLGNLQKPGPGLWPFIVSVVITTLSVILLVVGRGLPTVRRLPGAVCCPLSEPSPSSPSAC